MTYQEALDFLYSQLPIFQRIGKAAMKADLSNTIALAKALSNPERSFKSIHIAGTNGKGSTAHMYASVLQEAGYKVGLYTSPHLKDFRERIRVNGELMDSDFLVPFVERTKQLMLDVQPSFFEITVIMAFEYFRMQQVDVAVIETGLGGRLDSTNIVDSVLSVITSIALDHEDILGHGIENIAREKAGIIKSDTPVVLGKLSPEAFSVMQARAEELGAPLVLSHAFSEAKFEDGVLSLIDLDSNEQYSIESELGGNSLVKNVPVVIRGVRSLKEKGFQVSKEQLVQGINRVVTNTGLKGRWQTLRESPEVICDIGHNEEAVSELMQRLARIGKKVHIVWGMAADKSVDSVFQLLLKDARYYFCAAQIPRALSVDGLKTIADKYGLRGGKYASVSDAYAAALDEARENDVVFVGGSTFVVAEIKDL
ncbi:hypothetical protein BFP72_07025 [Reichenbachiella sp. 5M10]|uniref:bifunctional folylpolyglutamate synthase/dihydrofolate synthase n=1 Tax=Reichenbachiella sp. 5M10 TaxID=1889772 RepID=UPI000C14ECD2|nr:folylpolyglutamate synthase/dihydrofolate synthase family protein [Reichenbachiella sp. 5M10]PIB35166.1 hypothetical protein BFP72_07025 [Reichenbachiella sp. 5M10]